MPKRHVAKGLWNHLMNNSIDMGLSSIIYEIGVASKYIVHAMKTGDLGLAGTSNLYGEQQLALDVLADEIIKDRLDHTGQVKSFASEEMDNILIFERKGPKQYSVVVDPLDGSSLVDVNLAVGTIVGIYKGENLLQSGRNLVGAMYVVYGPRTTLVYSVGKGVYEFTLNSLGEYVLTRDNIHLKLSNKIYSPGSKRDEYTGSHAEFINYLESNGYKLRYSGGFVPDINQILLKGGGLFTYPATVKSPSGKLRLLFELNPMAFLIENAGGFASNGNMPILDIKPEKIDQREPVYIGSKEEVLLAEKFIKGENV
jgi:fructose-1,6-bisphosphatase I